VPWLTIVGIAPDIRQGSWQQGYLNPVVYIPYRQNPDGGAYLLVRSELPLATISDVVRRTVQRIDPVQPIRPPQTLETWIATERWAVRVFGGLFTILATIALTLSSVGLYAVMAYAVSHRTQEIGVRMAVGAQPYQLAWMVLRRGLWQLAIGLTLGTAGALGLSRVLAGLLVEITPGDPITFVGVAILLTVISFAACLLPTWRATRIDPVAALRAE
jgi:ABC-type antimicrobial peptide transport system permease subunit